MAKKKQEAKLKEPVRIRFKQLANGNQSIYLDYYTGDVILWNENKIMSVSSGHLTIKLSNFLIDIISMAKKKQEAKLKEPVRIRFKQLANGNQSIYLDYYTGDVILWNENKIMSVSSGHLTIKLSNFLIDIIKIAECFVYKI